MQLRVLGPVEASANGRSLSLGAPKQRAVLAMLSLEANRMVTLDHLIEGLWGDEPPDSAAKMVQNYVWRLRGVLGHDGAAEIVTHGRGYELRIEPESVDVGRLERLLGEANRAMGSGEPADAAREALALWRGPALADVADEPFAEPEIRRLEELRLEAAELAIDADLAAGRHQEVVSEIAALVADNPLRERFHEQHMLVLYRCGRQAEALAAYLDARRTLVEEAGVEPSRRLQLLHEAILRQDQSLAVEAAAPELPRELDATSSPSLVGRERELGSLRIHWRRAQRRDGMFVAILGAHGMGKTRLVAELAGEAHRDGATVLYAAGAGAPEAAVAAVVRARESRRPTLLVLDDADRAGAEVGSAIRALADDLRARRALVIATGQEAGALARLRPAATLALEPLDAAAVRQVALLYAPAEVASEIPVESLLESSRGVARRVHEVASKWAQREAARRVDAAAGRTAAGRTETRTLETELAGSVVDLQHARERAELVATPVNDGPVVCPFKGLATFDEEDAEFFFGRERLVAELVARLVGAPLLAVVGPSGSGKSSALRAGLLPALAGGVLPGSDRWQQFLIRPGEHPMRALRGAAPALAVSRRVVLALDQFEETFTACRDERQRDAFVSAIVDAALDRDGDNVVILAVRADFYGRCAAYPELARLLGANTVLVGPMSRDELRRAITRPAERVGLRVDPDLEDALVADVEGQPGALPLLSTALLELWRQRVGRRLPMSAYVRAGGVQGAVARLAEDAFDRLEPAQQEAARHVLLRLAGEGEGGAIVRRRVPRGELEGQSEHVARVVMVFTERRLLIASAGTLEVAHEALLREWPRLRGWLDEDAEGRRLHRHLTDAARDWDAGGRDPGELYRGARLTSALEWRNRHEDELNASERAFLDAGRAASARAQRGLRMVLATVAALLLIAVLTAALAIDQRGDARLEAQAAEAQRLGAQALTEDDLGRSLLLARQAVALDDTPATRGNLLAALLRSPAAIGVMRGDGAQLLTIDLHPDGRTLAVGGRDGRVLFIDTATRRRLGRPHQTDADAVLALGFSPDGSRLAVVGTRGEGELLDTRSRRLIAPLRTALRPEDFQLHHVLEAVTFSPDSRVVAVEFTQLAPDPPHFVLRGPRYLLRWDARTGRQLGPPARISRRGRALVGFTAGATQVVSSNVADGETAIRDAATLRPLRRFPVAGAPAAVSPDGRVAALAVADGALRLLDLRTGDVRTASGRHEGTVNGMRFTPDSRTLITAGADGRVIVWDIAHAAVAERFDGHAGAAWQTTIAPDGATAFSAGDDGNVISWDLQGDRRLGRPFDAGRATPERPFVVASPDGTTLAVPARDGSVQLFDSRSLKSTGRIPVGPRAATAVAIAPDGRTAAVATADGQLGFWDLRDRRLIAAPVPAHGTEPAAALSFSDDGRWLASGGGGDTIVRLWDVRTHATVASVVRDGVRDVSMSPDGKMLALTLESTAAGSGRVEVLSVPRLVQTRRLRTPPGGWGRFSRDGRSFVYGDDQGRAWRFDTRNWKPRGRPLAGHAGRLATAELSPDGRLLATTSTDGTSRQWDAATGAPIGTPLPGAGAGTAVAAFVRGGSHLVVVRESGRGYVWDVRTSSWMRHACAVAGRTLTRAEWENALPEREYAPSCRGA